MPVLFSYGSLQQYEVQLATFGRELAGRSDTLPRFRCSRIAIDDPAIAARFGADHYDNAEYTGDPTTAVPGTAYEVTETELSVADEYERQADYVRVVVALASGRRAWVYVDAGSARAVPPG